MKRLTLFTGCMLAAVIALPAVAIMAWAAEPEIQRQPYLFVHEAWDHPDLNRLREQYDFDEYCLGENNEFLRMIMLKSWVYHHLRYSFSTPYPQLRNSLKILRKSSKGTAFLCSSYAAVYMQCALSMGWTSRYIFLRKPSGEMHAAVDVWSNVYKKWVYIDPTWNIHLEGKKKQGPLSVLEMRDGWIRDRGKSLIYVYGAGRNQKRYDFHKLPITRNDSVLWRRMPVTKEWISYTYEIAYVGRNNFFTHGDGSGMDIWDSMYIVKDGINEKDTNWPFADKTPLSVDRLFHNLNICRGKISVYDQKSDIYNIRFVSAEYDFYTPSFSHFQVETENNKWTILPGFIEIGKKKLREGFRIRTLNKRNVPGPACLIRMTDEGILDTID